MIVKGWLWRPLTAPRSPLIFLTIPLTYRGWNRAIAWGNVQAKTGNKRMSCKLVNMDEQNAYLQENCTAYLEMLHHIMLKKGWYVSVFHCPQVGLLNKWSPACNIWCFIVSTVLFKGTRLLCKQSPVLEKLFPALVEHLEQGDSRTGGADKSRYAESLLITNSDHEPESCDRSVDRSPNWHSSHSHTATNRSCMVDEHECDLRTHSWTTVGSFYTVNSERKSWRFNCRSKQCRPKCCKLTAVSENSGKITMEKVLFPHLESRLQG